MAFLIFFFFFFFFFFYENVNFEKNLQGVKSFIPLYFQSNINTIQLYSTQNGQNSSFFAIPSEIGLNYYVTEKLYFSGKKNSKLVLSTKLFLWGKLILK